MNTNVFWNMSYGVYVVSTLDGDRPVGCVANSIMQITAEPATIAVSMNHDNYTNSCIEKEGSFAFSILSEASDPSIIGNFGFQSSREINKFETAVYETKTGMPVLKDSCGYVVCKVVDKLETKTHTIFLGQVVDGDVYDTKSAPMTYSYYHKVVKGKSPKNAPTYLPEEEKKPAAAKYICTVCGYVYEGEELPEDFKCPICKQGADKFVKQ